MGPEHQNWQPVAFFLLCYLLRHHASHAIVVYYNDVRNNVKDMYRSLNKRSTGARREIGK